MLLIFNLILFSPSIQSFLARQATSFLANNFDLEAKIEKLYFSLPNKIVLEQIELKDSIHENLLSTEKIIIKVGSIDLLNLKFFINDIKIFKPEINVYADTLGKYNFEYVLNKFNFENDSTPIEFKIRCEALTLEEANFKFKDFQNQDIRSDSVFDFTDFYIKGITTSISEINYDSDTISVNIKKFSCSEQLSGFKINEIKLKFKYFSDGMIFDNFRLEANNSKIVSSHIELKGNDKDYLSDIKNKLSLVLNLDSLAFQISDLAYFLPEYKNVHERIYLSGKFSGRFSKIKINDLNLSYGLFTRLSGDLSIDGLPNYEQTFLFGNITDLNTNILEISKILKAVTPNNPIKLPKELNSLVHINFKGNITGLMNDFVTNGLFTTNLGTIKTDAALISDFDKNNYKLTGNILANSIQLGKILNDTTIFGNISFKTTVNGNFSSNGMYKILANCNFSEINLFGYNYSGILVDGNIENNLFDGKIKIDDENLKFDFAGKYQYSSNNDTKDMDFTANLIANLSKLHILPDSTNSIIQLNINSNINGNFATFPEGNLNINNVKFTYKDDLYKLNYFDVNSFLREKQQFFTIRSDYCNLNLYGTFLYIEIINKIQTMLSAYLPALIPQPKEIELSTNNKFNFTFTLTDIDEILQNFVPNLSIPNELYAGGKFNDNLSQILNAHISIPQVVYDSTYFWGNEFDIYCLKDSAQIFFANQEISSYEKMFFENINLETSFANNETLLNLAWNNNNDSIENSGLIKIKTIFSKEENKNAPIISNTLYESKVMINNALWKFQESQINIDPNELSFAIKNFLLSYKEQNISINGEISNDNTKILNFAVNNVDIGLINPYLSNLGYQFEGILTGNGRVADFYHALSFRTLLSIDNLKINDFTFGRLDLSGLWNGQSKGFNIEGNNRYVKIKGGYLPADDKLDVKLQINNLNVGILEPITEPIGISGLDGSVNINIDVNGQLKNPKIEGYIDFNKTELTYEMLNLQVILDDRVQITKNAISFNDFKFEDHQKNTGTINGGLYHNNFTNLRFDFNIHSNKIKVLNTTAKDNTTYYGTVYGTGDVKIAGNAEHYGIDVNAKTEPNSIIVLPMTNVYSSEGVDFMTFIKHDTTTHEILPINQQKSKSDYYLLMDVEITPDATVQIDFDPKIGDIIRVHAKGNLKMEYNSDETFNMYGEAEVVDGNYLFTLENVINKKFTIKPGGTLTWTGDPVDATIDLNAIYQTRAPLKDLLSETLDSTEMYKSANVDCKMHLTGILTKPDIEFGLEIPNGSEKTKNQLLSLSQDEINKQFVFLLIMNRFFNSNQNLTTDNIPKTGEIAGNTISSTSFELISNQISNWLSQISKDFDIGFKYHPGTNMSEQEFEVAMSTQILNDRLLINGNVGYGESKTTTNTMVGDIEIQYKITPSGNFRVKGFSRKNDDMDTENGPYTAGIGVYYTKEFNTFKEMITDIWEKITFKTLRDKHKAKRMKEKAKNSQK
ncbi:MAG: translocation/assembly module TamB [Bacteroidales bacterium]|jgi:hypothetical protein|nr:translocation/assembly module TamB [Bacteroidales bacterium]